MRSSTDLAVRVAEADVVLDQLRALGREHEPGVERAAVVDAAVAQRRERRQDEPVEDVVGEPVGQERQRRPRAHAAGVRARRRRRRPA